MQMEDSVSVFELKQTLQEAEGERCEIQAFKYALAMHLKLLNA